MTATRRAALVLQAWCGLAWFDAVHMVTRRVAIDALPKVATPAAPAIACDEVVAAFETAACLYWKPVLCLQRSICMVRLLRGVGVPAKLVIG